jgi:GrpB-like predicted nucleotidyltransferase (UPF0157 family)
MSAPSVDPILLAEYDPAWATIFEQERRDLEAAIGDWAVAIEHVGSTAVPGLAAKPVIDIGVALRRYEDALLCITPLVKMGYRCQGEFDIPGRIFFRKLTDDPLPGQTLNGVARTHQIHMYESGHWQDVAHILFRDALRRDSELAQEYAALKRELAAKYNGDVEAYAEAKTDFVRGVVSRERRAAKPPIQIMDYDPEWRVRYERERDRILAELGKRIVDIEHIGSTAVAELPAKPVIDIMPGVPASADIHHCIDGMQRLGYEYVPDDTIPDRLFFRRGYPERKLHVHVVEKDGDFWRRHIAFRDYLRAHRDVADEYAVLKRKLAEQYPHDSLAYTDGKTEFILGIEEKAAAAMGPSSD